MKNNNLLKLLIPVGIIVLIIFIFTLNTNKQISKSNTDNSINDKSVEQLPEEIEIIDNTVIGILTIPKIELNSVEVRESVELETLALGIGHFTNTPLVNGNIGLAAHSFGTKANVFENLYKLEIGDEVIYKTKLGEKRYKITMKKEIDSADWSYLSETDDNRITMITCVKNKENVRLCVQCVEV